MASCGGKSSQFQMWDICLEPSGHCACAEQMRAAPSSQLWPACGWRVRAPWWTLSPVLLQGDRHSQHLASEAAEVSGLGQKTASQYGRGCTMQGRGVQKRHSGTGTTRGRKIEYEECVDRIQHKVNGMCGSGMDGTQKSGIYENGQDAYQTDASFRLRTPSPEHDYPSGMAVLPPRFVFAPPMQQAPKAQCPRDGYYATPVPELISSGGKERFAEKPSQCHELKAARGAIDRYQGYDAGTVSTTTSLSSHDAYEIARAEKHVCQTDGDGGGRSKRKQRPQRRKGAAKNIAMHLRSLEDANPNCVFQVRNIGTLGFDSPELLRDHFESYGEVESVLLANAHEKSPDISRRARIRPSGLAFIKMHTAEAVRRIVKEGVQHVVAGKTIQVKEFEHRGRPVAALESDPQNENVSQHFEQLQLE